MNEARPITYVLLNCTGTNTPASANVGDTVTVTVSVPSGYTVDPLSGAYVKQGNNTIQSTYNNGTLTFTMPPES